MELVIGMDVLREYWWIALIVAALVVALLLLRPRQRVRLTETAPVRPHMAYAKPSEGRGLAGEAAAAASDVTGQVIGAPVRRQLDGEAEAGDDLTRIKGVGPRFSDALHALGFERFVQLAKLSSAEIERIDPQLGAFSGRITRDRIVEQADYLARGDIDGFEQAFGKL
jgi:predicted flap endonuclease-1-like 5' DNA nuclease